MPRGARRVGAASGRDGRDVYNRGRSVPAPDGALPGGRDGRHRPGPTTAVGFPPFAHRRRQPGGQSARSTPGPVPGSGAPAHGGGDQDQRHPVLLQPAVPDRGESGGDLCEPVHRAARRRRAGGDGRDPRGAGHLRQLQHRDADSRGLAASPPPRSGGGDDWRRRGDAAPGRAAEAAAAPPDRSGAGPVPERLEQTGRAREGLRLTWTSPLSTRYASPAMQALWSERRRIGLWRRLWLALMEAEQELGLPIPADALVQARAHLDDVDLDRAAEHEKRLRHDVMAHILALGDQAPAARPYLHLGATSAYVTDNADLLLMREALQLLLGRLAAVLVALGKLARKHRALPCLAYTHFQAAQLTTVGKRITRSEERRVGKECRSRWSPYH